MSLRDLAPIRRVSLLLKSCREASGYDSAREFYDCAGGLAVLRCSYATYRRLEEPGRLPKPGTFEKIFEELETSCAPKLLRLLARAYAQALLGTEMSAWPPEEAGSGASRLAGLPETPGPLWDEIEADPEIRNGVIALERGRASARDRAKQSPGARRALNRLARAGLARRSARGFVPVAREFPVARTWAPTVRETADLRRCLLSEPDGPGEIIGGATTFVHSDREDLEELFGHLRSTSAKLVRTARAEAHGGESPVYLLEVLIRERVGAPEAA
jgi:hypothetical protein